MADLSLQEILLSNRRLLMEGALGECLKREYGIKLHDIVAMGSLIYDKQGRDALAALWKEYLEIAEAYQLPLLVTTPTRRANKERVKQAGFSEDLIKDHVHFLKETITSSKVPVFVGGLMGRKGDAYTGSGALSLEEARSFHDWQARLFEEAGADFLYAGIMPTLMEACGMAQAMSDTGLPYLISFTIQKDGKLIDHTTIHDAITFIDEHVNVKPLCYMTNCVHPDIVYQAIKQPWNQTTTVKTRFLGIQANTSALDYDQLDASEDLKTSDPITLACAMERLKEEGFRIFGGCCGTDQHHMEEIAKRIIS